MPTVTVTLSDTPTGGVAVHTDFQPAIGAPCSPAQSAALEILSRTRKDWGMAKRPGSNPPPPSAKPAPPPNPPAAPITHHPV